MPDAGTSAPDGDVNADEGAEKWMKIFTLGEKYRTKQTSPPRTWMRRAIAQGSVRKIEHY